MCAATAGADAAFVGACRRVFDAIDADRGGSLSRYRLIPNQPKCLKP